MTNNFLNNWGPVVIIIIGYIVGVYFQNRHLDIFKEGLYKYLGAEKEGLYKYLGAEFESIKHRLDNLETRVDKLEDSIKLIK